MAKPQLEIISEYVTLPNGARGELRVARGKFGHSGSLTLSHEKGGGKVLPISFGREPRSLVDAMKLAKNFLASVYGRSN